MFGLMQDHPLLISSLIEHAGTFHPEAAIVSRLPGGRMHRTHWHGLLENDAFRRLLDVLHHLVSVPSSGRTVVGRDPSTSQYPTPLRTGSGPFSFNLARPTPGFGAIRP